MKKVLSVICILALLCTMSLGLTGCKDKVEVKATIGVLQLEDGETYNAALNGFKDSLNSRYAEGEIEYVEKHLKGDETLLVSSIQELVDEGVNAIVTLGDEASVAAVEKGLSVPVFFLGVSDAVSLGLTGDMNAPDKNATGAVAYAPVDKILEQVPKLVEVTSYGIIYDESDANAKTSVEMMTAKLDEAGIAYEVKTVTNAEEATAAATALSATCAGIFLPGDATVNNALEATIKAAGNVPVFACDENAVQFGAVLAVTINAREIGGLTGQSAYAYLSGTPIAEIPVIMIPGAQTHINQGRAVELGYTLNDEFLNTANLINKVNAAPTEAVAE